jgi:hypothetical protein
MRKHKITEEEKIALKLSAIMADLRLDLEMVGRYFGRVNPNVSNRRLQVIAEASQYEKDIQNGITDEYNF